ncbi:MAG TPA: hypothetical protein VFS05_07090 [Gemmatimonadaceae bacterium]|nr:hypothetical protein [Gemmatimonadaceae bacterium]
MDDLVHADTHARAGAPAAGADVHLTLERALEALAPRMRASRTGMLRAFDGSLPPVALPERDLIALWGALLREAVECVATVGGSLRVRTFHDGPLAGVEISDVAVGAPADVRRGTLEPRAASGELGASRVPERVKRILNRYHGSIDEEGGEERVHFTVRLPPAGAARATREAAWAEPGARGGSDGDAMHAP